MSNLQIGEQFEAGRLRCWRQGDSAQYFRKP